MHRRIAAARLSAGLKRLEKADGDVIDAVLALRERCDELRETRGLEWVGVLASVLDGAASALASASPMTEEGIQLRLRLQTELSGLQAALLKLSASYASLAAAEGCDDGLVSSEH